MATYEQLQLNEYLMLLFLMECGQIIYTCTMPQHSFFEFVWCTLPIYFGITFISYISVIFLTAFILALVAIGYGTIFGKFVVQHKFNTSSLDNIRGLVMTCVITAIFASDFRNYNSAKLGKSTTFGFELMDVGVGIFTFNAGFMASRATTSTRIKTFFRSLLLSAVRAFTIFYLGVYYNQNEFGRHLNYFFNLAMLTLLSWLPIKYDMLIGLFLGVGYEVSLYVFGLKEIILMNQRNNLFMANLEGVCFLVPEFALFLVARSLGNIYFHERDKLTHKYTIAVVGSLFIHWGTLLYTQTSRRLHNLNFNSIMLLTYILHILVFDFLCKRGLIYPVLVTQKFISRNMLGMLIYANIGVGACQVMGLNRTTSLIQIVATNMLYLTIIIYLPVCCAYNLCKEKEVKVTKEEPQNRNENVSPDCN